MVNSEKYIEDVEEGSGLKGATKDLEKAVEKNSKKDKGRFDTLF